MFELTSRLVIYRGIGEDSILMRLSDILRRLEGAENAEISTLAGEYLDQVHALLDLATANGFDENLWKNYLAYLLATTETPFTLVSEKVGAREGSVNTFAMEDIGIFKKLFEYDFAPAEEKLGLKCFSVLSDYHSVKKQEGSFNLNVSEKVRKLSREFDAAKSTEECYKVLTDFYRDYGVGKLGLNQAFRVDPEAQDFLSPITTTGQESFEKLYGYEMQKERLIANTESFVKGHPANNVLLYGDAGTGKSTSIKALLNRYYPDGLRMIEVYKHEFSYLSRIISAVKNRNYRFIIYMDDLSFEEFEVEYKYLKAVIEGGLEPKPENVLIYATSNRRHLIRETWSDRSDRSDDELHRSDTVQEKLSLADRFGVTIGYFKPSPKEFQDIVLGITSRYPEITLSREEILLKAHQWEMRNGGLSGRVAEQFVKSLLGGVE